MYRMFLIALLATAAMAEPSRLNRSQLEQARQQAEVFLLDVRNPEEIDEPGAYHIPLSQLESRLSEVPRDRLILTL